MVERSRSSAWARAVLGLVLVVGCAGPEESGRAPGGAGRAAVARDVVLITVDTLRADALGFAGNREVATPALDRLAGSGRVFEDAHAHAVTTLPSHASMLTGLYPYQHGVRKNGSYVLSGEFPTAASRLRAAGFATGAFVGAYPVAARFGLDHGFEVYDDELRGGGADPLLLYAERSGDVVVERAIAWWRARKGGRRFLWVHLFEPHAPYAPPERFAAQAGSPYLGEVATVDAYLTPLIAEVEETADATLVVFTSDHGEALGDHGESTHGLFAYEATLRVPLVLRGPGVEPGRDGRAARHVDLLPTILAAAGVEAPAELPGRSLLRPAAESPVESYFESLSTYLDFGWAPLRGVIRDGKKLIELPVPELYDLATDPAESENLLPARASEARDLARRLREDRAWPPAPAEAPPEVAERLRSLGYLSGPAGRKTTFGPGDDPKNLVDLDRKMSTMNDAYLAGDLSTAVALGQEVLAARPDMTAARLYLAAFQIQAGDLPGAIETLEEARRRGTADRSILRQLGLALASAGRAAEAVEILQPLTADPADLEAANHLAIALTRLGRGEEALAVLLRALETDPDSAPTHETLSYVELVLERPERAHRHARRAVDLDPGRRDAWKNLGLALYQLARPSEAVDALRRAADLPPEDPDLLFNLALLELETGQAEAGRRTLRRFLAVPPGAALEERRRQASELLRRAEAAS